MNMTLEEFENEIKNNEIEINDDYYIDDEEKNFSLNVYLKIGKIEFEFEFNEDYEYEEDDNEIYLNLGSLNFSNDDYIDDKIEIKVSYLELIDCNVENFLNEKEESLLNKISEDIKNKIFKSSIYINVNNFEY